MHISSMLSRVLFSHVCRTLRATTRPWRKKCWHKFPFRNIWVSSRHCANKKNVVVMAECTACTLYELFSHVYQHSIDIKRIPFVGFFAFILFIGTTRIWIYPIGFEDEYIHICISRYRNHTYTVPWSMDRHIYIYKDLKYEISIHIRIYSHSIILSYSHIIVNMHV